MQKSVIMPLIEWTELALGQHKLICLGPQTESHVDQNQILDWYFNMWTIFQFSPTPLFIYVGDAQLFWYSWLHSFLWKHLGYVSCCFP